MYLDLQFLQEFVFLLFKRKSLRLLAWKVSSFHYLRGEEYDNDKQILEIPIANPQELRSRDRV
jgi:hypothetical protein